MFKIHLEKFSLGITAGIITSMGLIAGLSHDVSTRFSTITGLLVIAIADNISDSFGIHVYKEAETSNRKEVFLATFGNFLMRLLVVASFIGIVEFLPSNLIVACASIWGLSLLSLLSYRIAKNQQTSPTKEIVWHLFIAVLVIGGSKFLGDLIIR